MDVSVYRCSILDWNDSDCLEVYPVRLTISLCILGLVLLRVVNPARAEYYIQWVYEYSTWPITWLRCKIMGVL